MKVRIGLLLVALVAIVLVGNRSSQPSAHAELLAHSYLSGTSVYDGADSRAVGRADRSYVRPSTKVIHQVVNPLPKPKPKPVIHHLASYHVVAKGAVQAYALKVLGTRLYICLAHIVSKEDASWDPLRYSGTGSGAYGIPQALPGSKMASAGSDWRTNGITQIRWMIGYVNSRYGDSCQAWAYWKVHHSY